MHGGPMSRDRRSICHTTDALLGIRLADLVLVAAYHALDRHVPYQDLGADWFQRRRQVLSVPNEYLVATFGTPTRLRRPGG